MNERVVVTLIHHRRTHHCCLLTRLQDDMQDYTLGCGLTFLCMGILKTLTNLVFLFHPGDRSVTFALFLLCFLGFVCMYLLDVLLEHTQLQPLVKSNLSMLPDILETPLMVENLVNHIQDAMDLQNNSNVSEMVMSWNLFLLL